MRVAQSSFSGGEFSPSLYSRIDVQKYATGLKTAKNMIIHPHGGASNRPGTRFICETKDSTKKSRVVAFEFSIEQAYVIEFGHLYCRFYMDGGQIEATPGVPYEIVTPYDESDLEKLHFTQSADVLYIVHPDYPPKLLVRSGHTNWSIEAYDFKNGPFMPINTDTAKKLNVAAVTGNTTLTANFNLFNIAHIGALFQLSHDIPSSSDIQNLSSNSTGTALKCGNTWRVVTGGNWEGTLVIQQSDDSGSTWYNIRSFYSKITTGVGSYNANTFGSVDGPSLIRYVYTYVAGTLTLTLSTDPFTQEGIVEVTGFTSATIVSATVKKEIGAISQTIDWSEGSWSEYRGFPSSILFYQDRLAFACTYAEPQTIWFTKIGIYDDFGRSNPLVDSDGISINIPSRKVNGILNMIGLDNIIALTSSTEWAVGPNDNGLFTPSTTQTKIQGYRGSSQTEPLIIGNRAIYVQQMGAVVRDIGFDYTVNGFVGNDLSIFSTHLFDGFTIKEMTYQQYPDSIAWAVRSDGKLLAMTYMKEHEVLAWTPQETDGQYESVCSIPESGYNQIWFVIKRGTKRYIERMVRRLESLDPKDQFFVDSGISYDGVVATTITGLEHLEGKTVAILGDGNVYPQQVVVGGEVTLNPGVSKAHIGLPYQSNLETLNIEVTQADGVMQGRLVKVAQVIFRFLNTKGGYFGSDADNLDEIIPAARPFLDTPLNLFSGEIKESLGAGFEDGGRVYFRQKDPLPVTILSVVPIFTVGN